MKILIAGASGLIGKALSEFLASTGHTIVKLSRQPGADTIVWNPKEGHVDNSALEGFDAFINLAGENIAGGRWTEEKKKLILESRIQATSLLVKAIQTLKAPPKVLINASAIGYYGSQGDNIVDEDSPSGQGFLAEVCRQWEAATEPAKAAGVRVVIIRIGVVLSKDGGALANMLTPFKLCLGGRIGSGRQYMSWVSLNELIRMIDFALRNEAITGPVNAVAPCPVQNIEFTKTLGKALGRPTVLPMPAFAVRWVFGELGDELLLSSTRVHPTRLQKAGYTYYDPHLSTVLRKEVQ